MIINYGLINGQNSFPFGDDTAVQHCLTVSDSLRLATHISKRSYSKVKKRKEVAGKYLADCVGSQGSDSTPRPIEGDRESLGVEAESACLTAIP